MGIIRRTLQHFLNPTIEDVDSYYTSLENDLVFRNLAIETCIDLIANAMLKVEYKTYKNNRTTRNELYYRLNVAPNGKQNASEFYKKLIHKLYYDNEVLIISPGANNTELFVAEDYSINNRALKPDTFTNVMIDDMVMNRSFKESEVIYLKLSDTQIRSVVNGFYASYGKLLSSAMNVYKRSNARRYVFKGDVFRAQNDTAQGRYNEMMTAQFKPFMEADNAGAVFQMQDGFELKDFSSNGKADSRDVRNVLDDVMDMTASAFHVPKGLLKGDISGLEDQIDSFLIFTIHPLVAMITDEVNSKLYDMSQYLSGEYVKADTSNIKITDVTSMAAALDKLFAIGAMSVNDISLKVGSDPIDEEWANKRFITKNYAEGDPDAQQPEDDSLKGGEENNEKPKPIRI